MASPVDEDEGPVRVGDDYLERFSILGVLGRGGFGWVYRAVDKHLGREVAIKVSHRLGANHDELYARAKQEAQLLWKLRHPNVVEMFEASVDPQGRFYIVMEYLRGHSLTAVLRKHGRLTIGEMMRLVVPLTQALEIAHRQAIVHRDLKPDNVIVTFGGEPKIIDFGIAKILGLGWRTMHNKILGTSDYLSPEQLWGKTASPRSDMYALGVMTFIMLYGRHPLLIDFPGRPSDQEMVLRTHTMTPPFLHELIPDFPESLSRLVYSQLSKEPGKRYESAGPFGVALLRCARELQARGSRALLMRKNLLAFDPENPASSARAFAVAPQLRPAEVLSAPLEPPAIQGQQGEPLGLSDEGFVTERERSQPEPEPTTKRADDEGLPGPARVAEVPVRRVAEAPMRRVAEVPVRSPEAPAPTPHGSRRSTLPAIAGRRAPAPARPVDLIGYFRYRETQIVSLAALAVGLLVSFLSIRRSDARDDEVVLEAAQGEGRDQVKLVQRRDPPPPPLVAPGESPRAPAPTSPPAALEEAMVTEGPAAPVASPRRGDPPPAPAASRPAPRRSSAAKKKKDPLGMDTLLQMVEEDLSKGAAKSPPKTPDGPFFRAKE